MTWNSLPSFSYHNQYVLSILFSTFLLWWKGLWMCPVLWQAGWYHVDVVSSSTLRIWIFKYGHFCLISLGLSVSHWLSFVIIFRHETKFTSERSVSFLCVRCFCTTIKVFHGLLPVLSHTGENYCCPTISENPTQLQFWSHVIPSWIRVYPWGPLPLYGHTHTHTHSFTHPHTCNREKEQ